MRKASPDDLTDTEWELIEPIFADSLIKQRRAPKYPRREILNAIFDVLRTSCQWRDIYRMTFPVGDLYIYNFGDGRRKDCFNKFMIM